MREEDCSLKMNGSNSVFNWAIHILSRVEQNKKISDLGSRLVRSEP
jgi:hypothetical protein